MTAIEERRHPKAPGALAEQPTAVDTEKRRSESMTRLRDLDEKVQREVESKAGWRWKILVATLVADADQNLIDHVHNSVLWLRGQFANVEAGKPVCTVVRTALADPSSFVEWTPRAGKPARAAKASASVSTSALVPVSASRRSATTLMVPLFQSPEPESARPDAIPVVGGPKVDELVDEALKLRRHADYDVLVQPRWRSWLAGDRTQLEAKAAKDPDEFRKILDNVAETLGG